VDDARSHLKLHVQPAAARSQVPGFAKDGGKNVEMKTERTNKYCPSPPPKYSCSNWKWWLNNTTITLGMQNVFDEDPPFVAGRCKWV
jgi:hypothetical protein